MSNRSQHQNKTNQN